jgi:hypothetical protein
MTEHHPIKPSQEQLQQWMFDLHFSVPHPDYGQMNAQPHWMELVERVAQWGADYELEKCCEWAKQFNYDDECYEDKLRAVRRPKPPSLKEQALTKLTQLVVDLDRAGMRQQASILEGPIRRALEQLND